MPRLILFLITIPYIILIYQSGDGVESKEIIGIQFRL